jgi:hypothetical protein
VRRTGGFIGRAVESTWGLPDDDPRSVELAALVARIDPAGPRQTPLQPDRFTYEFELDGLALTVREQDLTDDLRRVAELVLSAPG